MTAPTIPMRTLLDALAALTLAEAELLPVATSKAWQHVMKARNELAHRLATVPPLIIESGK